MAAAATSLKAVIFAAGYSIVLVDVPSLAALPAREMDVKLDPLSLMTVTGRIVSPTGPGGTFSVRVQDFSHDPALARFSSRGEFTFSAVDPITKGAAYRLGSSAGLDLAPVRMSIAASQIATTPLVHLAAAVTAPARGGGTTCFLESRGTRGPN